jgi:hypothetical protein
VAISAQTALFENQPIRRIYDEATDTWFFSVVDIVRVLTQQADATVARKYWNKLKQRLRDEGSELVTNCHQLKLTAEDGKQRLTDVANAETLLRLVQSVPSPKAEPIKNDCVYIIAAYVYIRGKISDRRAIWERQVPRWFTSISALTPPS